jgi:MbtH protein
MRASAATIAPSSAAAARAGGKKARARIVYPVTGAPPGAIPSERFPNEHPIMTQAQPSSSDADDVVYTVVINDEAQYSIWPTFRDVPAGWREVGVRGPKADCLAHIDTVWTDMRPASLRRHLDGVASDARAS